MSYRKRARARAQGAAARRHASRLCVAAMLAFGVVAAVAAPPATVAVADHASERITLGRALFFDPNLSLTRTQSCASCHAPERAYSEPVTGRARGVVPVSADGTLLGARNAPPLGYAALVPRFGRNAQGEFVGGLFHDGRAASLEEQAGQPITNPREMQMADAAAVVARLRENPGYVAAFRRAFDLDLEGAIEPAFAALGAALAAYERSPEFVAFDSRYDRALRGELRLTAQELRGRDLFYSTLTNCARCHVQDATRMSEREPFTSHRYFNIGTPANVWVTTQPGAPAAAIDEGLAANPNVGAHERSAARGRFRAPSLRNVAVTGPYMHNGVFERLETVIAFYNRYLGRSAHFATNPETGQPWADAEVPETIELGLLEQGQPSEADRIADLAAFLRTLTDRRYEHLLAPAHTAQNGAP